MNTEAEAILKCEEKFNSLFCEHFKFSKHLIKYQDDEVFDMYDHNFFKVLDGVELDELIKAYKYQEDNNRDFLKLLSLNKLKKNDKETLDLEEGTYLTMLHRFNKEIKTNDKIIIKDISLKDLNKIELKHYGKLYGEGFIKRRNKQFIRVAKDNKNFRYLGAYLNGKIVGACHAFSYKGYSVLDSLIVDNRHRHHNIASTLIKYVLDDGKQLYLHADDDDTPKEMYKKMGFRVVLKEYEYFRKVEIKEKKNVVHKNQIGK